MAGVILTGNIEGNNSWPPKVGSNITFNKKNSGDKLYLGKVFRINKHHNVVIIVLQNYFDYRDEFLIKNKLVEISNYNGYISLFQDEKWEYIDATKLTELLSHNNENIKRINKNIEKNALNIAKDKDNKPHDNSLLTNKNELKLDNLFGEKSINQKLISLMKQKNSNQTQPITILEPIKSELLKKLTDSQNITENEKVIPTINTVPYSESNILKTVQDEEKEGNLIVNWIKTNVVNKLFDIGIQKDLLFEIHNGYVHIVRMGINPTDNIDQNKNIPDKKLKYFTWQDKKPIEYDVLKYVLFQNSFQQNLPQNIEEREEAKLILSQEYIISLQPEPEYQMWALKRLLLAWYTDVFLTKNIRKIKVLINQWRARSDKEFNQTNGVLPSIVIYPKYGTESGRNTLNKISGYFLLYQHVAWDISKPTYFVEVSKLIYYTNGDIDLKSYVDKANGDVPSDVFKSNGELIGDELIVYPTEIK